MLTTTSMSKTGKAVGVLTSLQTPPDIVTYDVAKPEQIKQLTAVNDDILKGKKLGDGEGDVVHVAGRPEDPGLVHHAARTSTRRRNTRCSCTSTAGRTACTASASTTDGRSTPPTAT